MANSVKCTNWDYFKKKNTDYPYAYSYTGLPEMRTNDFTHNGDSLWGSKYYENQSQNTKVCVYAEIQTLDNYTKQDGYNISVIKPGTFPSVAKKEIYSYEGDACRQTGYLEGDPTGNQENVSTKMVGLRYSDQINFGDIFFNNMYAIEFDDMVKPKKLIFVLNGAGGAGGSGERGIGDGGAGGGSGGFAIAVVKMFENYTYTLYIGHGGFYGDRSGWNGSPGGTTALVVSDGETSSYIYCYGGRAGGGGSGYNPGPGTNSGGNGGTVESSDPLNVFQYLEYREGLKGANMETEGKASSTGIYNPTSDWYSSSADYHQAYFGPFDGGTGYGYDDGGGGAASYFGAGGNGGNEDAVATDGGTGAGGGGGTNNEDDWYRGAGGGGGIVKVYY